MRKLAVTAILAFVLTAPTFVFAAETFDGLWVATAKDCRDTDRPDSKTQIDLGKTVGATPSPMVDRYENHCRVDRKTATPDGWILTTTCFEFWDDYKKGINGQKGTIKLSSGPKATIRIDGKPFQRCNIKKAGKRR